MSWLYSIIFAGLMFSNQSPFPVQHNSLIKESNIKTVVKLDETEKFEQIYPLNPNGKVSVSNINGSITIDTWDRNEVQLVAVKSAQNKERFAEVDVKIDSKPDSFSAETDYEAMKRAGKIRNNDNLRVDFSLMVPRNAVLDEIETVNGSVTIANAGNMTKASTVNGQVRATNLRGTVNLSTVNGTVAAEFDQLQTAGKISLNTVNGSANLTIPSDANAIIKADTLNGSITNDFGLPVRKGQYIGRHLYGKIGSGDVQIRLNSVNGGLTIQRKNDGKNLNPATNMLSPKPEENFEEDYDAIIKKSAKAPKVSKARPPVPPAAPPIAEDLNEALIKGVSETAVNSLKMAIEMANSEEIKAKIKESQLRQMERMAKLPELNWLGGAPVIEKKGETFAVKNKPKVTVVANDCSVIVRGWDKQEVQYYVTKVGRNIDRTPLDVQAQQKNSNVDIKVMNRDSAPQFFGNSNVRLEIFVPKKSNLNITTDGEIRLEGISGEIELSGADGAINVRDSDGKMRLTAADARIRVLGFSGEVYAQTADGDINLEGSFEKLFARSEDGSIILTVPADFNADVTASKEIFAEGLNISKEQASRSWRLGQGGADFQVFTNDGQIYLRGAGAMKSF